MAQVIQSNLNFKPPNLSERPAARGSTAKKYARLVDRLLVDHQPFDEFSRHYLARGAKPAELAGKLNDAIAIWKLSDLDRERAIRMAISRLMYKFFERDGAYTKDTSDFCKRLRDWAFGSDWSRGRVLDRIEKVASAMLAEKPAWPIETNRKALRDLQSREAKIEKINRHGPPCKGS